MSVHLGARTRSVKRTAQDANMIMEGHTAAVEWLKQQEQFDNASDGTGKVVTSMKRDTTRL